ncbi:hypothetical protein P4B35_08675 [Pontiellaceae bacterium B12227]|nr:hypothetical protein [Pontiellaceae bacterium B12227]
MNHSEFQSIVQDIYASVHKLETMFPDRHFTPDGHMVGSIGECLVADAYGLELMSASNAGFDAKSPDGREVEIKATQRDSVAFRSRPEHTIIIKINPDGSFDEFYNGPGELIWEQFKDRKRPKNGQYQISLSRVQKLAASLSPGEQLERIK